MSITCYALMFLLVTTKLHYVLIIADSDFIEEFACFSMFFATTNHFSCHWLIEVWLVYIFFNAVACLYSCLHYAVTKTSRYLFVLCLSKYCDSCSQDILSFTAKFMCF